MIIIIILNEEHDVHVDDFDRHQRIMISLQQPYSDYTREGSLHHLTWFELKVHHPHFCPSFFLDSQDSLEDEWGRYDQEMDTLNRLKQKS